MFPGLGLGGLSVSAVQLRIIDWGHWAKGTDCRYATCWS